MPISTCDLCDAHPGEVRVLHPVFRDFGGALAFHGRVRTVRCAGDNSKVAQLLRSPGEGCVLVVDGGGDLGRSLVGGMLAEAGARNGWAGVVVDGAVRDAGELAAAALGIKARALIPLATVKRDGGEVDVPVEVAGVRVAPGDWLYADADGVVVADRALPQR